MPNLTPLEIEDAIAAVLQAVTDVGVVVTDRRYSQGDSEIVRLLKTQNSESIPQGWFITWEGIVEQNVDAASDCHIVTVYEFSLAFAFPYSRDNQETSEQQFKTVLFDSNEALNANLTLGDNRLLHRSLQSTGEFDVIISGTASQLPIAHYAEFSLSVEATNSY